MKQNTKFLFIYIAILFSFALVLILFAGLTQNNYAKEIAKNQGIKQNLLSLTDQNETLTDSMKKLNSEYDEAKNSIEELNKKIESKDSYISIYDTLIQAQILCDNGRQTEAADLIKGIDKNVLTEKQLYIYNKIISTEQTNTEGENK